MFRNLNPGAVGFSLPFEKTLEAAGIGGFHGIDVNIIEMTEMAKSRSLDDAKLLLSKQNLKLAGWGLPMNLRENEETYRRDLAQLSRYAGVSRDLGCKRVFTWIVPYSDELPFRENFQRHVERLRPVAETLGAHGCNLGLEFIGPKTSRIGRKYGFIHTIDGMLELCEAVGTKNLALLLDSWHWYTSHGTLDQLRNLKNEEVVYVHINDAPLGIPVDEQIDNVRSLPGETGVIDLVGFLRALKAIGYDGPVTPEPFSRKLKELPPLEAVKTAGESLNRIWRAAGVK